MKLWNFKYARSWRLIGYGGVWCAALRSSWGGQRALVRRKERIDEIVGLKIWW